MEKIKQIIESFSGEIFEVSRDELKMRTDVAVLDIDDFTMMWNTVLVFIPPVTSRTGGGIIFTDSSVFDQLRARSFGFLAGMSATADSIGEEEQKLSDFYDPPLEAGDKVYFNPHSGVIYRDEAGNCFRLMRIQDVKAFAKGNANE